MATGQQLIDRTRRLGYVDSSQYTDAFAEEDMNIVQEDIANTIITEVGEDFFWEIFTTDLVQNQNEYTLPTNMYKLLSVSYLPDSTTTEYRKLDTQYPYELPNDISYYETSGDEFYYVADGSVFIYPKPTEAITGGLKLTGIKEITNISKTSTEADILNGKIPAKFHHLISLGMLEYLFQGLGKTNEAINAKNQYLLERSKLVEYLSDRVSSQLIGGLPNLNYYA